MQCSILSILTHFISHILMPIVLNKVFKNYKYVKWLGVHILLDIRVESYVDTPVNIQYLRAALLFLRLLHSTYFSPLSSRKVRSKCYSARSAFSQQCASNCSSRTIKKTALLCPNMAGPALTSIPADVSSVTQSVRPPSFFSRLDGGKSLQPVQKIIWKAALEALVSEWDELQSHVSWLCVHTLLSTRCCTRLV